MKIHATEYLFMAAILLIIAMWLYVSILNIANYHKYKDKNASSQKNETKASGFKRIWLYLLCKLNQIKNGKSRRNQGKT